MANLSCFHCKKPVELDPSGGPVKVGFRDTCPTCHTDLHACRNCALHDEGSHHECREPQAEWVRDKERANLCEYFRPSQTAKSDAKESKGDTLKALDNLFK